MVAYSFKRRFVEPIRAGRKAQTIRADRKRHARAGELLQLYTGMRTVQCGLIGLARCSSVEPVRIIPGSGGGVVLREGLLTGPIGLNAFAAADGFANWSEFSDFWDLNHPGVGVFMGVLIKWIDLILPESANVG